MWRDRPLDRDAERTSDADRSRRHLALRDLPGGGPVPTSTLIDVIDTICWLAWIPIFIALCSVDWT